MWRRRTPRRYTTPQLKAMQILQQHGVTYVSEQPFPLSAERGDGVVTDIYLPQRFLRIECDDPFFPQKAEKGGE
jgi:hypothetical protein